MRDHVLAGPQSGHRLEMTGRHQAGEVRNPETCSGCFHQIGQSCVGQDGGVSRRPEVQGDLPSDLVEAFFGRIHSCHDPDRNRNRDRPGSLGSLPR